MLGVEHPFRLWALGVLVTKAKPADRAEDGGDGQQKDTKLSKKGAEKKAGGFKRLQDFSL